MLWDCWIFYLAPLIMRKEKIALTRYGFSNDEYSDQNHYDFYYDNALANDLEAIREMRDIFGEDWNN